MAEMVIVESPVWMESIEENDREAGEFDACETFGTNTREHVFGNGIQEGKTARENLMTNIVPANSEVTRRTKLLGVFSNLECRSGVNVLDACDGTDAKEFQVADRESLGFGGDRLTAVFGVGGAAGDTGELVAIP